MLQFLKNFQLKALECHQRKPPTDGGQQERGLHPEKEIAVGAEVWVLGQTAAAEGIGEGIQTLPLRGQEVVDEVAMLGVIETATGMIHEFLHQEGMTLHHGVDADVGGRGLDLDPAVCLGKGDTIKVLWSGQHAFFEKRCSYL